MPIHGINPNSAHNSNLAQRYASEHAFSDVQWAAINDLVSAIETGNVDAVRDILNSDKSILEWRQSAHTHRITGNKAKSGELATNVLHKAITAGELEVVQVLCNEYHFPIGEQNIEALTGLHIACQILHGENYSENIQAYSENGKPEHYKIAEFLVNKAIDGNMTDVLYKKDVNGFSIVNIAKQHHLPELAKIVNKF